MIKGNLLVGTTSCKNLLSLEVGSVLLRFDKLIKLKKTAEGFFVNIFRDFILDPVFLKYAYISLKKFSYKQSGFVLQEVIDNVDDF